MGRFKSTCLGLFVVATFLSTAACGALDGSPSPTATPNADQQLAGEVVETYGKLLLHARLIVEPRPAAAQAKQQLHNLREEFKVQFANFACLLDAMNDSQQAEVMEVFDERREDFLPQDMAWLEDAAADYDLEDPDIRPILEDLLSLDDYAFLARLAETRPGAELRCG